MDFWRGKQQQGAVFMNGRLATNRMKELQKLEKATKLARKPHHDVGYFDTWLHPKSDRTKVHRFHTFGSTSTRKGSSEALPKSWQIHSPGLGIIFMLLGEG